MDHETLIVPDYTRKLTALWVCVCSILPTIPHVVTLSPFASDVTFWNKGT